MPEGTDVYYFSLDGTCHVSGKECICREGRCEYVDENGVRCAGTKHYEACYGGYIDCCDVCDKEDLLIVPEHEALKQFYGIK